MSSAANESRAAVSTCRRTVSVLSRAAPSGWSRRKDRYELTACIARRGALVGSEFGASGPELHYESDALTRLMSTFIWASTASSV